VMRSCIPPMSIASVGWYPTAEGMRPSRAETSEPAWVKRTVRTLAAVVRSKEDFSTDVVNEEEHVLSFFVAEIPSSQGQLLSQRFEWDAEALRAQHGMSWIHDVPENSRGQYDLVRATRARAPGGSFICPNTRATLDSPSRLMTPVSCISW
jgi:hypothetical protein